MKEKLRLTFEMNDPFSTITNYIIIFFFVFVNSITLVGQSGNVGIGVTNPQARLHVDSTVIITGLYNPTNTAALPVSGEGTRMMWIPRKSAFRAGTVDNNQWDFSNIGNFSTAWGSNTTATGLQSTAIGYNTTASGSRSVSMGENTAATGSRATAIGYFTRANGFGSTVVGMFNAPIVDIQNVPDSNTPLFMVGNGDNENTRSNAFLVRKDGRVGIGTDFPDATLHVYGLENDGVNTALRVSSGVQHLFLDGNEIDATKDDLYLQNNTLNNLILMGGGGNVGISKTSPSVKLDIADDGDLGYENVMVRLESTVSKNPIIGFSDNNGGAFADMSIGMDGRFTTRSFNIYNGATDPKFTVLQTGNVGIGTDVPLELLTVYKSGNSRIRIESSNNVTAGIDLVRRSTNNTDWRIENNGNLKLYSSLNLDNGVTEEYSFGTGIFRPSADNDKQLGASQNRWTRVYAVNGTIQTSDRRFKKNIAALNYGLTEISALNPVTYQWKDGNDDSYHLGLIAQEVQKIIPEVVEDSDPESLGMNYAELVPVLIQAIQELSDENEALKKHLQKSSEMNKQEIIALQKEFEFLKKQLFLRTQNNSGQ